MNIRMLPPTNVALQTRTVNGRTYSGAPGTAQSVPDFDAGALEANGWTKVSATGSTSARPVNIGGPGVMAQTMLYAGMMFFDETLGFLITYDGATWRNPSTGASV